MNSAPGLAIWIASVASPTADPTRQRALGDGASLLALAESEGELAESPQPRTDFARWLGELKSDGWIAWNFSLWPGETEEPAAWAFSDEHLQRCQAIRPTPEGWRAVPGLLAMADVAAAPPASTAGDVATIEGIFVSHASEDKDAVARPLALELQRREWKVWFDEFELTLGDGLRRSIDRGLAQARFGVVVLSPSFFAKEWPQRELDGLVARELTSGDKVVLPIWHGVDAAYVARFSPPLADKLAVSSSLGVPALADVVEKVLHQGGAPSSPVDTGAPPSLVAIAGPNPVLDAIMAQNDAVLREVLRRELAAFVVSMREIVEGQEQRRPDNEVAAEVAQELLPVMERLATQLLPLIEHDVGMFEQQLRLVGRQFNQLPANGYTFWSELRGWAVWWLVHVLGAYAVRRDAFAALRPLLTIRREDAYRDEAPLLAYNFLNDASVMIGEALAPAGHKWISPTWEHLVLSVSDSASLRGGWPELFETAADPRQALAEWSFIQGLGLGLQGEGSVGFWSLCREAVALPRRLRQDERLRAKLAIEAFALDLTEFDARAPDALGLSRPLGPFADTQMISALVGGDR